MSVLLGSTLLTVDELDAVIYALNFTFGENAHRPHDLPHNTRVEARRKLKAIGRYGEGWREWHIEVDPRAVDITGGRR